jgi:hypothetical protein
VRCRRLAKKRSHDAGKRRERRGRQHYRIIVQEEIVETEDVRVGGSVKHETSVS